MLYPSKTGTVLEGEKGGRSWKEKKKRDGPGRRKKEGRSWKEKKRGTVLREKKERRSWKKEKRDGPGRRRRGTVLKEKIKDCPYFFYIKK